MRLLLAILVASSAAQAKDERVYGTTLPPKFGENPPKDYHSSQWFAFELKMGSYSPDIDSSPGLNGATPFSDLFNPQGLRGRPPGRLLTQIEFDVQFFRKVGSLGFGTSVGYYRRTTHSFQYPGGGEPMVMNGKIQSCTVGVDCVRSGDQTALNIIPLEAMLVYRFDYLMLRYRVPFVPYVKLGLAMDAELGINHSYVFAELHWANVDGFGAANKLVLSDLTWNVGLAFEF
jgi:hypothetical protein